MIRQNQIVLIFLLCLLAGCGTLELKSPWRDREVVVDGKNTEWRGSLTALDDKQSSIGLLNDGEYLYIGLTSTNQNLQRQVMRRGITFWFDRDGGKGKKFGIHFPIDSGRFGPPRGGRADEGEREPHPQRENFEVLSDELEIYGPAEGESHRMTMAQTGGIEARIGTSDGILVYELKIPLMDNGPHLFAIGTKTGASIGVGVETLSNRSFERPPGDSPGYGDGRGGGFGGRGGRGRGGFGSGRSRSGEQAEPLKVWAKVQLSAETSSSH